MADGFIVRRGGAVTEQALAPTITEVSTTQTSITFTITNNDASTAVILYEVGDTTPDENSIELATGVTSDSIEITGLDIGTEYTVSATASVTGKVLSNVTSLAIETDEIIYTAATGGTTLEYDSGGKRYKSHTFTSDDDFEVTTVGDNIDDRNKVDYLIIAGGGGGGSSVFGQAGAGGGGAGGFRTTFGTQGGLGTLDSKITVTATTYGVVIGAGGAAQTSSSSQGNNGTSSSVFSVSTVGGGGGGAGGNNEAEGSSGGSGGGNGYNIETTGNTGTANQGFAGGVASATSLASAAGGGGAGEIGGQPPGTSFANSNDIGGAGGDGLASIIRTGSSETRAGGGAGGGFGSDGAAAGGSGGGGNGANASSSASSTSGTTNTGSGGGGGYGAVPNGAAGGSGIVIIRYEIAPSV